MDAVQPEQCASPLASGASGCRHTGQNSAVGRESLLVVGDMQHLGGEPSGPTTSPESGERRNERVVYAPARGPQPDGIALCVLHHKLFDLGAFTLDKNGVLLVSDQANGSEGFSEALLRHHGARVRSPQRPEWHPAAAFTDWHGREVFKGAARHIDQGTT
jgi:hypothetical protein